MNIKTGIDIIEVDRIKESIEKFGERFLNKVFTKGEIQYCESKNVQKFQSFAGRFAAKEAMFKCISEYLNNKFDIEWRDIEILNDEKGKPIVYFHGKVSVILNGRIEAEVSISHIKEVAVASCIVQQN